MLLLQNNGLIKLKEGVSQYSATPNNIVENPKKLKYVSGPAYQSIA
ncbi:Methionine ABC transporter substrate-binding protein [Sporomusa ovata]|uniref:Methionine ABC transporter substrate-binding protein n=1 Tax=Sporomusa ovata TaxID=2378 RepID=A0A0U1L023_9FIRM|nr:Methionine ABC transporter substrate-binding protein [Sporomusa ovata]